MYESKHVQHRIASGFINIAAEDLYVPAYWAHPVTGSTFPALVLVHEWWGLTPQIRSQVRRFAEKGYYVIAPDLFFGKIAANADGALLLQKELGDQGDNLINAALNVIATHHRVNGKVGIIGWQLGGELTLQVLPSRSDLRAAVIFYANPAAHLAALKECSTPILAFYGEKDQSITRETLQAFHETLAASPAGGEVVVYPMAYTGFFNDDLPTFNTAAAEAAWHRVLDFLAEHLRHKEQSQTSGNI